MKLRQPQEFGKALRTGERCPSATLLVVRDGPSGFGPGLQPPHRACRKHRHAGRGLSN